MCHCNDNQSPEDGSGTNSIKMTVFCNVVPCSLEETD